MRFLSPDEIRDKSYGLDGDLAEVLHELAKDDCVEAQYELSQCYLNGDGTEEDETARLTADQRQCLDVWNKLDDVGKELATVYMQGTVDHKEPMKTKTAE